MNKMFAKVDAIKYITAKDNNSIKLLLYMLSLEYFLYHV